MSLKTAWATQQVPVSLSYIVRPNFFFKKGYGRCHTWSVSHLVGVTLSVEYKVQNPAEHTCWQKL